MIKLLVLFLFISSSLCIEKNYIFFPNVFIPINATFSEDTLLLQYTGLTTDTIADFTAIRKSTNTTYIIKSRILSIAEGYRLQSPGIMHNDFIEHSEVGICSTPPTIPKFQDFACPECEINPVLGSGGCRTENGCVDCDIFTPCPLSPYQAQFGIKYCELGNKTALSEFNGIKKDGPKVLCKNQGAATYTLKCLNPKDPTGYVRRASCLSLAPGDGIPVGSGEFFEPIGNPFITGVLEISSPFFLYYINITDTEFLQLFDTSIGFCGGRSQPIAVNSRFDINKAIIQDQSDNQNYYLNKLEWCTINPTNSKCFGGIRSYPLNGTETIKYFNTISPEIRITYQLTPIQQEACVLSFPTFDPAIEKINMNDNFISSNLLSIDISDFEYKKHCEEHSCELCNQPLTCGRPNCSFGESIFFQCKDGNTPQTEGSTINLFVYLADTRAIIGKLLTVCNFLSIVRTTIPACIVETTTNEGFCNFEITVEGNGSLHYWTPAPDNGIDSTNIICNQPGNKVIVNFPVSGIIEQNFVRICQTWVNSITLKEDQLCFNSSIKEVTQSPIFQPPGQPTTPGAPKPGPSTPSTSGIPKFSDFIYIILGVIVVILLIISIPIISGATTALGSAIGTI